MQRLSRLRTDDQRVERRDRRLSPNDRSRRTRAREQRDRRRTRTTQHNVAARVQFNVTARLDVVRADDLLVLAPGAVKQHLRPVRRSVDDRLRDVAVAVLRPMLREHHRSVRPGRLLQIDGDNRPAIRRRCRGERPGPAVVRREHVAGILRVRRGEVRNRLAIRQEVFQRRIRQRREHVCQRIEPHHLSDRVHSGEILDVRTDQIVFAPRPRLPHNVRLAAGSLREHRMMPPHREEAVLANVVAPQHGDVRVRPRHHRHDVRLDRPRLQIDIQQPKRRSVRVLVADHDRSAIRREIEIVHVLRSTAVRKSRRSLRRGQRETRHDRVGPLITARQRSDIQIDDVGRHHRPIEATRLTRIAWIAQQQRVVVPVLQIEKQRRLRREDQAACLQRIERREDQRLRGVLINLFDAASVVSAVGRGQISILLDSREFAVRSDSGHKPEFDGRL